MQAGESSVASALVGSVLLERFEVVRQLGSGAMGTVYEAFDRKRGMRVALKSVGARSPQALFHLKHEFRALQGLRHRNLVELYELLEDHGHFFFTMELLEGVDFLAYVRAGSPLLPPSGFSRTRRVGESVLPATLGGDASEASDASGTTDVELASAGAVDLGRLGAGLAELAEGLAVLHDAGLVHRDVKPSNVLVTREGRVVLVDFGLTEPVERGRRSIAGGAGTRAFMAPEQAAGRDSGPPADCYALGVVVYLALSGRLPFSGADVERKKAHLSPPSLEESAPEAPAQLKTLCHALLDLDPARRPSARELSRLLGAAARAPASASVRFRGRGAELAELHAACAEAARKPVFTLVVGESGVGKSALVRHFASALGAADRGLLLLTGRCHERELVPYKAFDGIIDELSAFLAELSTHELRALLPPDAPLLSRVFPVLRRVRGLADEAAAEPATTELRGRAFAALRSLFRELSARRRVVLVIDDLQWADADSLLLLGELLRAADAPSLLVLATSRPPALAGFGRASSSSCRCPRTTPQSSLPSCSATLPSPRWRAKSLAKRAAIRSSCSP